MVDMICNTCNMVNNRVKHMVNDMGKIIVKKGNNTVNDKVSTMDNMGVQENQLMNDERHHPRSASVVLT